MSYFWLLQISERFEYESESALGYNGFHFICDSIPAQENMKLFKYFKPKAPRLKQEYADKDAKLVDCFTFFNELELLKLRLELLFDVVDEFCISEANMTFSGNAKPFILEQHLDELKPWVSKIRYLKYQPDITKFDFGKHKDSLNEYNAPWKRETEQRDLLIEAAQGLKPYDLMLVCDIDEIPNPETLRALKLGSLGGNKSRLEMDNYYYYMNCKGVGNDNKRWIGAFVTRVGELNRKEGLTFMRHKETFPFIKNGGWHFSYLGGPAQVSTKIASFSHTEFNTPEINNLQHLQNCIELGIDYLGRGGHELAFVPVATFPEALAKLMRQNPKFVKDSLL